MEFELQPGLRMGELALLHRAGPDAELFFRHGGGRHELHIALAFDQAVGTFDLIGFDEQIDVLAMPESVRSENQLGRRRALDETRVDSRGVERALQADGLVGHRQIAAGKC